MSVGLLDRLPPLDAAGLDEYVRGYRAVFRRRDQLDRFRDYLRGLLDGAPGKTAEAIAARVGGAAGDYAQALQHFVTSSPWDDALLLAAYRACLGERLRDPEAVWVVLDLAFPEKGRHSIGVQRQFARPLGRKLNCQVAVAVAQVGPAGTFPLALQLYLPSAWRNAGPADGAASKSGVALGLIEGLLAEWRPAGVVGDEGYEAASDFREGLAARGLTLSGAEAVAQAAEVLRRLELLLGLDGFEGRSWRGWHHHVALVLAAYGFLATRPA